ncbi:sensor histidine kinase [Adlercreutzia sp. ZJ141]|uniref:sensor histidine kinase n=1 Tax=Adlercreutzia sp. ZJ141 TaxID=2709406 RepID=UPI001F151EEF|nr:HAMP domain-containing sensor histidine kinase [Adlercreutzia sp. ZJ141]
MDGVLAIAVLVVVIAATAVTVALYERELKHIAYFLRRSDRSSNERATVGLSTPGISSVAAAVNSEMDKLRDERSAMDEQQETFRRDLAALSHDIRTPLTGAQGYLQLYERSSDPEEQARCLREAASRLAAMRELTDKLFEYSKAVDTDRPLELGPVEVLPVLAEVLAGAYPQFAARGWEARIHFEDEDVTILGDEESLARVFSNLLSNSLRYGASAPAITQEIVPEEGDMLVVISVSNEVTDPNSIETDRLFERFYRADGARGGGGSGLGLAIVASLCSNMGGFVEARLEGNNLTVVVKLRSA